MHTHKPLFIVLISFVSSKLIPPNLSQRLSQSCVEGRAESSDACDVWRLVVNVQAYAHITDALHQLETSLWGLLGISNFERWVSCRLGHPETPAGVPRTRCVQWRVPIQNHGINRKNWWCSTELVVGMYNSVTTKTISLVCEGFTLTFPFRLATFSLVAQLFHCMEWSFTSQNVVPQPRHLHDLQKSSGHNSQCVDLKRPAFTCTCSSCLFWPREYSLEV